jgi:hypothetical protein
MSSAFDSSIEEISTAEKEVLEELNLLRSNPKSYMPVLEEFKAQFKSDLISFL